MSTFCLQAEKKSSAAQFSGSLKARISVSHNANTKAVCLCLISAKNGIVRSVRPKASGLSTIKIKSNLSSNIMPKPLAQGKIRTLPKYTLNVVGKNKNISNFKEAKVDKFAGNIDRIKQLVNFNSTQKLYPIKDIITSLNNSYFVTKDLQANNLYSQVDEGVAIGQYVHHAKNSSLISDEKISYIQPSSIFTKGDFRYKFEVTRPNNIDESFLLIRAAAPVSNYSSNIPPQYRLHNIKLEDPSGNLIIKYKDITIRGDADYNTDYVNFTTYISEPETNNLKLNIWDSNYPLMDLPSGYSLNIDFAIDCLDDPFSYGFDKGYEDTCKLEFVNSSNNDYLSLDGSPLSTQTQNFSLNPTNSIRISAIEIANSGGIGVLEGSYLKFYTEVSPIGQRLIRNILPTEFLQYNQDLGIYPAASSVWQSSSDDFGNFGLNTSASGSNLLLLKLQDSSYNNYIKLIYTDPVDDSGRLTLKFSHSPPNFVDTLTAGAFNLGYNTNYNRSILQSIQEIDSFFVIDDISLKIVAKKESGSRNYALDVVGFSDDKLLNITPKLGAFLQNQDTGIGSVPITSGFYGIDDLGISSESLSDKSQYFESNITNNPAGDHYKLSTVPLVTGTSFQEYIIPLSISSNQYSSSSNFESLYLDLYNLPSGAVISTAQLVVTYKPANGLMLHTLAQESSREFARRTINIYPSQTSSGQKLLNSYITDGTLSNITNIPHGFSEDPTIKTNYSRRWRAVDGLIVDGPYDSNQFDFSFYNPQLNTPFLNGYFTFNNDIIPFIISEKVTSENQPLSGIFVGDYEKTKNIGLRFDNTSLFNQNDLAKYWIPSEDEWYKAAFYDPTLNEGNGGYWNYPTQSNTVPTPVTANSIGDGSAGPSGNFANFNRTSDWNGENGNITTVGTNGGPSYYGTFDQAGNTYEWNDAIIGTNQRGIRGGYWFNLLNNDEFRLSTTGRNSSPPTTENSANSFRIATISNSLSLSNFITVSNSNNSNDVTGYGGVPYIYQIGKYEVTQSEYAEFLNAVAKTDTYNLYNTNMDSSRCGILRTGSTGNYTYTVKNNWNNKPIVFVNWFMAARYCNWLHNGKPSGIQNSETTESGAYELNGTNSSIVYRNEIFRNKTIDWTTLPSYENHELHGKILDSYDNAIRLNGANKYIKFENVPTTSGFSIYARFTPDINISGVGYNLFNSGVLLSKWDNGENLEFALGYQNGHLCGYARTSTGSIITVVDPLNYDEYQYPLSILLTYNDNLSEKLKLYTDNEILETFDTLRASSSEFVIGSGSSDICFGYCSGSGVGINAFIHEIGISTYNASGTNILESGTNRLLKQNTAESFLRGHRSIFNNNTSRDFMWSYVDDNTYDWKLGDFKICAFSPDFDSFTRRIGSDFIIHSLRHSGSGYNITSDLGINHSQLSYHSQIENDFLRFNLSDIPESENFYSTYPRICKTLPRNYNFEEESIVVETILEHETNNNIAWDDNKVGPKLIVSLYTKNQDPALIPNAKNWGLINRSIHYLEPSGCFVKLRSYLNYQDLVNSSEPWADFDIGRNTTEFDHKYFSKDINDMFLQYDLVYPSGSAFDSSVKIHSANIKLENAIRKSAYSNEAINLSTSGELISFSSIDLYSNGKESLLDNINLIVSGELAPSYSDTLNLFSFGAYVDNNNINLFTKNIGEQYNNLFTYIVGRSDKSDEQSFNLFAQNRVEDQTEKSNLNLYLKNKTIETVNSEIYFSINAIPLLFSRLPEKDLNLSIVGVSSDGPIINNSFYLYTNTINPTDSLSELINLFIINYPAINPLLNQQETISWNSINYGKDIETIDNNKAFLNADDEIRGVDIICYGVCDNNHSCYEESINSHSIVWNSDPMCVDGGILRPKNTYTNLETSGFKTDIGYSGHFYGIRKYDGLIPSAPYSITIEAQTGNNKSIKLPFEFTEIEYGSNEYVNYSGIKLVDSEINIGDNYGESVSIKNNLMAIGAPNHSLTYYEYENNNLVSGTLDDAGAVFIYRRENRPSGYNWPIDKDKSPWLLETKLTLPSGILKDYYTSSMRNSIGGISLPLSITERRWQVGQEGREFGHSVAIGINSGIKSFEEDKREIIVVGGPSSKWTPRPLEELQTSGVQVGILVFTDEFTPNVVRDARRGLTSNYVDIINNIQNKDLIFKYFSDPPVSFDIKIIICEPISDYSNRTPLEFPSPAPDFITKKVISRNQGSVTEERNEKILSGIKDAFHAAFPYDPTKLNNNIPVILGIYVDNTRSMRNAIDGTVPSLNRFISYYQSYSFASGLQDFYGTASSGAVVRYNPSGPAHWIDASNSTLDYILDTGRLIQDNQVRFFTSGVGQDAFNPNLSEFNYPPDSGGKVFVFEKESGIWNLIQEIKSPNITYGYPDRFGHAVAISDNTEVIAIGSPYISDSCQIFEFKQIEKDRVFNEISSWVSYKSSITGGVGRYANLISDYYSWISMYGYDYSNKILYSKLTSTEKFEARKYLNIQEYKNIYTYNQGNIIGKSKWNFIIDEFTPTARLGYSVAVNEDGSIVAFGAPTDSLNQWDDARVYYKNLGYSNSEDTSLNTNNITPAWRSNVNAGAVRLFESRKYYPHNKAIEYGKFGNLQKELNLPEDSGHFNYLPTIFQNKNFEVTPFSEVDIPRDAGLAFIITPSVDALSNEVLDNIVEWLSLGDRNLVLVGNDPVWEQNGVYSKSNEIINKILEELDSRMKLFPARNQNESCLTNDVLGIPTFVENGTSTYISRTNVNIHGVADIRTNFDNIPLLKDQIIRSSCSSEEVSLGNEINVTLPTANTKCEIPVKNNGDLRAQWYKYCITCQNRRLKYAINLPFYFSSFTPLCNCDEQQTKESLAKIRINAPNQEPIPILAAAKKRIETIIIPSSEPKYGLRPTFETRTFTQNSISTVFDENNISPSSIFTWSIDNPVDVQYLAGADNIIQPRPQDGTDGVLQILASSLSEQTISKKQASSVGNFCVEQSLYNSKIIAIAGTFTESESILYNSGLDKSIANDENINFYINMVLKPNEEGSRIKFLSSSWVGRSNFTDAYLDSQLHGVFLDNGNIVEYSDIIYSYDDICWIANPKNIPNQEQINNIKSWLAIGNKKLIITRDNSLEQMKITDELFKLLGSNIESLYLPADDVYPRVRIIDNIITLNAIHPISLGFNQQTSIAQISVVGGSNYNFIPFKQSNNIVPIAYYNEPIFETEIITNGYWKINSAAKVSLPTVAGSGYKIFINVVSDNEFESQTLSIYSENGSLAPKLPYPESLFGFYQNFNSTRSISFNLQSQENKSTIDFYISSDIPRISDINGYIPKTPKLVSMSGVLIGVKDITNTSSYTANIQTGLEEYLASNGEAERIITREFFDYIKNDNTQYCQDECLETGFDKQLIADGPVIVAQEQEHITSFNAGYNRSRITLISDSSLVQGAYLSDNEGRIPLSTLNFINSLYPNTDFSALNLGRQFNQQTKIVAPERGSPQKYLSLVINSGLNYKFGGGIATGQNPASFNNIESAYDPRYVLDPLDPWDISDDDVSIRNKINLAKNIFRQQEESFGAKSKFTETVDNITYKDIGINGGLPQLFKDKGYDHIDFERLPSGYPGDLFGYSISLYKDKLVIGAPFAAFSDQDINPWQQYIDGGSSSGIELSYNGGAGAVYIFEKTFKGSGLHGSLTPWEFTKKLRPQSINVGQDIFDGSGYEILGNHNYTAEFLSNCSIITDQFGRSVSIDSDIISVGAPGHDFDNLYINGSGSFIRKCFNEEFNIPSRKVIDLGSSGTRNQYPNSGVTVLNNGAIFTFENKIIDWPTKSKEWRLIEKLVPNERTQNLNTYSIDGGFYDTQNYTEIDGGFSESAGSITIDGNGITFSEENINIINGTENYMFGKNVSINRSFRSDSDYSIVAGLINNSGQIIFNDIMLRQPSPSLPSPSAYIQARVFGERDLLNGTGQPHVYISIQNNGENNQKYFASGTIYSDERGQIFVEASGQDQISRGFISHRPFISSIDGQYSFGNKLNGPLNLTISGANYIENNMPLFANVDNTAIVYNNLGLYNSAIIDIVNNLPSGLTLYVNPDPLSVSNSGLVLFASGVGILTDTLNMRIRGQA